MENPTQPPAVSPPTAQTLLAGVMDGDLYRDLRDPVEVPVPEGWVAEVGPQMGPFRLALTHVATGTRLELWSFSEVPPRLHPRAGCHWTFSHEGSYETIRVAGPLEVATCVPITQDDPLILATIAVWQDTAYHFETIVPPGRMAEAREATEEVLSGVRFK